MIMVTGIMMYGEYARNVVTQSVNFFRLNRLHVVVVVVVVVVVHVAEIKGMRDGD